MKSLVLSEPGLFARAKAPARTSKGLGEAAAAVSGRCWVAAVPSSQIEKALRVTVPGRWMRKALGRHFLFQLIVTVAP